MVFGSDGAAFSASRMESGEIGPRILRPPRIGESVVARADLPRQLGVTQLDGPLFDVQAKLRILKRQLVHIAEQPAEAHPVVSRKISPENRVRVVIDEPTNRIADFFPHHSGAVELRPDGLKGPLASFRPVNLTALGIKLTAVLSHQSHTDQIDGLRPLDELRVDPIFHTSPLGSHSLPSIISSVVT